MTTTADSRLSVFDEITAQRAKNHAKWGDRSIENRRPDYPGWLATLGEEYGEVCRALQEDQDRLRAELIDLAAVALMWIDSVDGYLFVSPSPASGENP
jgi:NTP pyrophosphatase (non-canonical NTP hydrolase)